MSNFGEEERFKMAELVKVIEGNVMLGGNLDSDLSVEVEDAVVD